MKKSLLIIALLSLLLITAWTQSRPTWEYKQTCSPKDMDKLGMEGWELTAATTTGMTTCLFFKRPR